MLLGVHGPCLVLTLTQTNQTTNGRFVSQFAKRGAFLYSDGFLWKNKENERKNTTFVKMGDVCEFSLFFQGKHSEFRKVPRFPETACKPAMLFGLLG